jgi:hypothetical protein
MSGYCTRADVLAALPSGGLPNPAREVTADATSDVFVCEGHGLTDGAEVTFRTLTDVPSSVPTGITEGTTYYAIVVSTARFKVSATPSGSAVDLTTVGENFLFRSELPWAEWIEKGARDCDSFLPAHVVPVVAPYPQVLVTANAEVSALRGLRATGGAEIDLSAKLEQISVLLARWAKTIPLRGAAQSVTSPVNLAITSTAGAADPRGWATCGNDRIP